MKKSMIICLPFFLAVVLFSESALCEGKKTDLRTRILSGELIRAVEDSGPEALIATGETIQTLATSPVLVFRRPRRLRPPPRERLAIHFRFRRPDNRSILAVLRLFQHGLLRRHLFALHRSGGAMRGCLLYRLDVLSGGQGIFRPDLLRLVYNNL